MNVPLLNSDILNSNRSYSPNKPRPLTSEKSPTRNFNNFMNSKELSKPISSNNFDSLKPMPVDPETFKVFIRARPLDTKEITKANPKKRPSILKREDNMIFVFDPDVNAEYNNRKEKSYVFDDVFDHNDNTISIYNQAIRPALDNVLSGYNSTVLAYGMTGAGKTFTMFGDIYETAGGLGVHPGIITLIVNDLFTAFEKEKENGFEFGIKFSYIEIYNEQTRDLLSSSNENLMIVEDPNRGIIIPDLTEHVITTHDEVVKHILTGNTKRIMASTHANQFSSRSHAILQLIIEKKSRAKDIVESITQSKLCLVDLAGSERAATSENRGLRQVEGANINKSLLALGNCINILSDTHKKGAFVPYRDSKLTRMLKDSLGGNTRTVMVACVSPSYLAYEETINTLKYAARARKIKRKVQKNIKEVELHVSQYKEIIESLKSEIEILKKQLAEKTSDPITGHASQENQNILDDLGKKLLTCLEEHWEVSQSLAELRELKSQNQVLLNQKMEEERNSIFDALLHVRIMEEIAQLKEVMENNTRIEIEMENTLRKNAEDKALIQEKILKFSAPIKPQSSDSSMSYYEKLEKDYKLLSIEKSTLANRNMEIQKEAQSLVKEKQQKDYKIMELEKQLDQMRRQLQEKDNMLAKTNNNNNNQIQKGLPSGNSQAFLTPFSPIPKESDDTQASNDSKNDIKPSNFDTKYSTLNSEGQTNQKKKIEVQYKNANIKAVEPNTPSNNNIIVQQSGRGRHHKQTFQPVSIQELKTYAEKIKNINFDNVPSRHKRKKKNPKTKHEAYQPTPLQNLSNFQSTQGRDVRGTKPPEGVIDSYFRIVNRENEKPFLIPPVAEVIESNNNLDQGKSCMALNTNQNFSDLSEIMPNETSIDYSVKDLVLDNLGDNGFKLDSANRASQPNFHLNLQTFVKGINSKNQRFEVKREELPLKKPIESDYAQTPKPSKTITESFAKITEKPVSRLSERPALLEDDPSKKHLKESPMVDLSKKYWDLVSENNKFKNDIDSVTSPTNGIITSDLKYEPKKLEETPKSNPIQEIRSLESARDLIRTFKIKLYSLSYACDNNLLDDYYTEEIFRLIKDYNQNKYMLASNDVVVLKKLENAVFTKLNNKEPLIVEDRARSTSANPKKGLTAHPDPFLHQRSVQETYSFPLESLQYGVPIKSPRNYMRGYDVNYSTNPTPVNKPSELNYLSIGRPDIPELTPSNRAYLNPRGGLTPDPKSVSKSPSRFDFDGKPKANPMVQQLIDRQRNKMIDELERGRKGLQYPDPLLNVYGIKPNGDPTAMETPMRQI